MARDQIEVMEHLGFPSFALCGHDRGGRVGYRMALDHPGAVTKLAVLDIVPTGEAFSRADMAFGLSYWHWFFLAQPYDLPERLLASEPEKALFRGGSEIFDPEAIDRKSTRLNLQSRQYLVCRLLLEKKKVYIN